jgi:hypothetical protein
MLYWGIDPGKRGAIAVLRSDGTLYYDRMPNTTKELADLVREYHNLEDSHAAVVEHLGAMPHEQRASIATFKLADNYGKVCMAMSLLKIPYRVVNPRTWQSAFISPQTLTSRSGKSGNPDKPDKSGNSDKPETTNISPKKIRARERSRRKSLLLDYAKRWFPDAVDWKTKTEGLVVCDAMLLALYCERIFKV